MNGATVLGLSAALIITATLFEMLRRQRLREKHALVWFLVAVLSLVLAIFPGLLEALSSALHVQVPANLLFFLASLFLMAMSLQHSSEIGRLEERTRTLAEEVALLRLGIDHATQPAPDDPEPGGTDRGAQA